MLDQYVDQALRRRTAAGRADWVQPGVYYRHRDSQQVCWISKPLSICTFLHAPRNYFLQQGDPELLSISHFVSNTRASDLRIVLILNLTWTAMNQWLRATEDPFIPIFQEKSTRYWCSYHAWVEQNSNFPHALVHPANSVSALPLIADW
jgi:hypothetical protein